jgi:hypothetical protein
MATRFTYTNVRQERIILGSVLRLIVKTLRPTPLATVRTTVANLQFSAGSNRGAEVDANATVHLQHRDDREPTRPQPAGRVAI